MFSTYYLSSFLTQLNSEVTIRVQKVRWWAWYVISHDISGRGHPQKFSSPLPLTMPLAVTIVTINPDLEVVHYSRRPFATLAGGQKFLSHAYQQVFLDEKSKEFVAVSTHKGLYRYNRLPFGMASACAAFQQLHSGRGLLDVLLTGKSDDKHLEEVFKRLDERGFRLKRKKCSSPQ